VSIARFGSTPILSLFRLLFQAAPIMLLSVRYRFLFVHIAKTGGTSVRHALARVRWRDPWYPFQYLCSRFSHWSGHRIGAKLPRHARIVAAHELLPQPFFQSLFKFAFVRNPWDLQVSSYHHLRRERPHLVAGHRDFKGFMRWKLNPERPYQFHIDTSIQPQMDYLVGLDGTLLVDFVGRYENLEADYRTIGRRIGFRRIPRLPHRRRARDRGEDFRAYYDDATAEAVGRHFQRDIDGFGYRFEPIAWDAG